MSILPQIEQQLLRGIERQARQPHRRLLVRLSMLRGGSPTPPTQRPVRRRLALVVLPLAVVGMLLGFMLAGGEGNKRFDVLAAVYRALAPGTGVRYIYMEGEDRKRKGSVDRFQYWSTANPWRERTVFEGRSPGAGCRLASGRVVPARVRMESAIKPGSTWLDWASFSPKVIVRSESTHANPKFDPTLLRSYYKSKTLRLAGKTTFEGRPAYRLTVANPPGPGIPPNTFLVAAGTFVPLETLTYARNRAGDIVVSNITRYRAYEELPPTPHNLALLNIAPHPGARMMSFSQSTLHGGTICNS